jgi:KipI family sensor histidine kinase inhibitor
MAADPFPPPLIQPLGDCGLLVRFADSLSEAANVAVIGFAQRAAAEQLPGVAEVVPNLVSVLLRYDAAAVDFERLAGEVRLLVSGPVDELAPGRECVVPVVFDGDDVDEVAAGLGMERGAFVTAHCARPLRVLAIGFAPGFAYCGFHEERLHVPRRAEVRARVPAGTVLFAAGQTAITSTDIPTGWHVIGHTGFRNFDPARSPPSQLVAGDMVRFEVAG